MRSRVAIDARQGNGLRPGPSAGHPARMSTVSSGSARERPTLGVTDGQRVKGKRPCFQHVAWSVRPRSRSGAGGWPPAGWRGAGRPTPTASPGPARCGPRSGPSRWGGGSWPSCDWSAWRPRLPGGYIRRGQGKQPSCRSAMREGGRTGGRESTGPIALFPRSGNWLPDRGRRYVHAPEQHSRPAPVMCVSDGWPGRDLATAWFREAVTRPVSGSGALLTAFGKSRVASPGRSGSVGRRHTEVTAEAGTRRGPRARDAHPPHLPQPL